MKIIWTEEKIHRVGGDIIAIPFRTGGENLAFETLDKSTRQGLSSLAEVEKFKGQEDRSLIWQGKLGGRAMRIMVLGVGKDELGPIVWRKAVAKATRHATAHRLRSIAVIVDAASNEEQINQIRWTTESLILAAYRFRKYKTKAGTQIPPKKGIVGVSRAACDAAQCRRAITKAKAAAAGVTLARDLVNEPANVLSPSELAERARALSAKKGLECTVLDEKEIRKQGMNLLLAVAAGSDREPRLIHLVYRPRNKPAASVALVGKGVTFDSGGLCVKPGKSMYSMKTDMAGAGVVLGVMSALKTLAPRVEVHAVIPATDNAIGPKATRPGDVIKSLSGLTVEVLNTDAEGRLILADALTYAEKLKPDVIIDHATLTGACLAALGAQRAGVFSSDSEVARKYFDAAEQAGELLWRLPLARELDQHIRSDVADIKNIGGQYGGAITAALFLKRFVKEIPWVHLDIAGPARLDKGTHLSPKGGSGFGVMTCLEYLANL
ncbi:MAG: leucyl aminopeptidase [Deltaproteobacteria bacterium]|nr:leucyl aminopeptidase [Deltaproteobacteria bacterium]